MSHLSELNILAENQHAFRRRRSCESQLILTINDLAKNLDEKATTYLITLDFSKAFDVIPHQKLLHKLHYYGIRSDNLRWVTKQEFRYKTTTMRMCYSENIPTGSQF